MWEIINDMATNRLWIYTALVGSLFGLAFSTYFKSTRLGLWLYAKFDMIVDYLLRVMPPPQGQKKYLWRLGDNVLLHWRNISVGTRSIIPSNRVKRGRGEVQVDGFLYAGYYTWWIDAMIEQF